MKYSTEYEIDTWQFQHNLKQHRNKLRTIRNGKSDFSSVSGTKKMLRKSMICRMSRDREIRIENQSLMNRLISINKRKPILNNFKSKRKEENSNDKTYRNSLDFKFCNNTLGCNKLPPISYRKHKNIKKKYQKENKRDTIKDQCFNYLGSSDYSKQFKLKAVTPVPDLGMEAPETIQTVKTEY